MRITRPISSLFFFFNDTATTEIYTLSLHDALPICPGRSPDEIGLPARRSQRLAARCASQSLPGTDRKSTRLNSSHSQISYAVFCLKKKNTHAHMCCLHPTTVSQHHPHRRQRSTDHA